MAAASIASVFCLSSLAASWYFSWKSVSHEKREESNWKTRTGHLSSKIFSRLVMLFPIDSKSLRIILFSIEENLGALEIRSRRNFTTVATISWRILTTSCAFSSSMVVVFYIYGGCNQTLGHQDKLQNVTWASEMMLSIIFLTFVNSCWRSWNLGMSYSGVKYGWLRTSSAPKLPGSTFRIFCSTTWASWQRSWRRLTTSAQVAATMTTQEVDTWVAWYKMLIIRESYMVFGPGTSHGGQTAVNWSVIHTALFVKS